MVVRHGAHILYLAVWILWPQIIFTQGLARRKGLDTTICRQQMLQNLSYAVLLRYMDSIFICVLFRVAKATHGMLTGVINFGIIFQAELLR